MTWKAELKERILDYLVDELEGSNEDIAEQLTTLAWAPERLCDKLNEFYHEKLPALDLYTALNNESEKGLFLGPLLEEAIEEVAMLVQTPMVLRLAIPPEERDSFDRSLRVDRCLKIVLIDVLLGLASQLVDGGSLDVSCFLCAEQALPLVAIELHGLRGPRDEDEPLSPGLEDLLHLILGSFETEMPAMDQTVESHRLVLALPGSIFQPS